MKKVFLWIALVVVAVLAIGGICLNRIAARELRTALAGIPGARIDFKNVSVSPVAGNLEIRGVVFELRDSTDTSLDIKGSIDAVRLERLHWPSLFRGEACADRLILRRPVADLVLPKKTAAKKDTSAQRPEDLFLRKVSLSEVRVEKGKIGLTSRKNALKASAEEIDFSVRDIGIQLPEGLVEYNDSCYRVALDSLNYTDEKGISRIKVNHLATADAGPVEAQKMHLYCGIPKEKVAERMGKVSAMWYDVKLDSLRTSSLNIPRLVKDRRVDIDSIHLTGPEITLFQDDRYPPAVPYPTLQEGLNSLKIPLKIKRIDAHIHAFTFIWETTHVNRGTFPMRYLHLALNSVSNAHNNLMDISIRSGRKGHSRLNLSISVRNDKQESTRGKMQIYDLQGSQLDPFTRPLFGATAKVDIHQIEADFKGDKHRMTSDFCMLYSGLALKAWDDSTAPYRIVAENSGLVSFLANLIVPRNNPVIPGKEPKEVAFSIERNRMLPYASYLIQILTDGMLKTVLPGSSIHKAPQK